VIASVPVTRGASHSSCRAHRPPHASLQALAWGVLLATACSAPSTNPSEPRALSAEVRSVGVTAEGATSEVHTVRVSASHGRVLVISTYHLDAFDTAGNHLASIGRVGDGPGEFRSTSYSGWGPDGAWIFDSRANRLVLLDPDLIRVRATRHAPTFTTATNLPIGLSVILGRLPSEHFVVRGLLRDDLPDGFGQGIRRGTATTAFVVSDTLGEVKRILGAMPYPSECDGAIAVPGCQLSIATISDDGRRLVWIEGIGIESNARLLRITRAAPDTGQADTTLIRLPAAPYESRRRDSVSALLTARGVPPRTIEAASFPPLFLAVSIARAGNDGVLWLGGPADSLGRPWTILDSLNHVIGKLHLDRELAVGGVSHDGAWAARDLPDGRAELVRITIAR